MTIRDLLSSYQQDAAVRLKIYDSDWNVIELRVCFNPGEDLEWVYEDDMIELDKLADRMIARWYVHQNELRIKITDEFER